MQTLSQYAKNTKETFPIAIDFDGTCVMHEFPKVGHEIGAIPCLKLLQNKGFKFIINTMRGTNNCFKDNKIIDSDTNSSSVLDDAVNWFEKNGLEVYGKNINPTQSSWTNSTKPYANLYIDDAAIGAPLCYFDIYPRRQFIDWYKIMVYFYKNGFISSEELNDVSMKIKETLEKTKKELLKENEEFN